MREKKEKHKQKFNERGITLIALVITIIVLLILAGVALSALTGDSGILNKAESAKAETNHKSIAEYVKLKMGEYQIEKSVNGYDKDFKTFLKENADGALIDDNGVINVKKLVGKKLSSGNGSDLNDVYVLEDATEVGEKSYKLRYYRTQTSIVELGEMGDPAKPSKLIITGDGEVDVKSTITLIAQPNIGEVDAEDIEWISSEPEVATVDNGVVTGVNSTKGTTIITAKYNNSLIGTKEIKVNPKLLGNCTNNCTNGVIEGLGCEVCGKLLTSSRMVDVVNVYDCVKCDKYYHEKTLDTCVKCGSSEISIIDIEVGVNHNSPCGCYTLPVDEPPYVQEDCPKCDAGKMYDYGE